AVVALRLDQWKAVFQENRADAFQIWREPFVELRIPLLFNLRRDPFEKAQIDSNTYHDWFLDRAYVLVPMQQVAAKFFETLTKYPPSQTPGSFNLQKIQQQLEDAARGR
ncbi:MAG: arylsulfatase, partial [Pirellulaceae bacterium]|nr:arylsulfatase [Pirellulaceae bacterium]